MRVVRNTQQTVADNHVSGRTDGKIFRDALDGASDERTSVGKGTADLLLGARLTGGESGQGGEQPQSEDETKHKRAIGFRPCRGKESREKPLSLALK